MKGKAAKYYSINRDEMKKVFEELKDKLEKIPENDVFWEKAKIQKMKTLGEIRKMLNELEESS